ncbi:MAG: M20 family metallo-hydrolase [bacterium]
MIDNNLKKIIKKIKTYKNYLIEIQTKLTSIPALAPESDGDGEAEKAKYIETLINELNYDSIEKINATDDRVKKGYRPNLIVKFKGKTDKKTIWIMAHMDVVPPGDLSKWDTDPYKVIVKEGKLYGRGTEDNQQGLVSALMTLKAFNQLNIIPEYTIGLAIVADEENGSKFGIQHVLKEKSDLFKKNDLILIPDAGDPQGVEIEVAEKSILWIKFVVQGKQTHGSTPEKGVNAHKASAYLTVKMNQLYEIFNKKDKLYDPPISTFEPTKKENNVPNINTIPGEDIVYFDCRILPHYSMDRIKKRINTFTREIEKNFKVTIEVSFPQDVKAPTPTPADAPVVKAIKKAVKDVQGRDAKPLGIGGGTVAAYFRRAGLPAVCWSNLDDTLHGPNEYCKIENAINDACVFAHIFLQK